MVRNARPELLSNEVKEVAVLSYGFGKSASRA